MRWSTRQGGTTSTPCCTSYHTGCCSTVWVVLIRFTCWSHLPAPGGQRCVTALHEAFSRLGAGVWSLLPWQCPHHISCSHNSHKNCLDQKPPCTSRSATVALDVPAPISWPQGLRKSSNENLKDSPCEPTQVPRFLLESDLAIPNKKSVSLDPVLQRSKLLGEGLCLPLLVQDFFNHLEQTPLPASAFQLSAKQLAAAVNSFFLLRALGKQSASLQCA